MCVGGGGGDGVEKSQFLVGRNFFTTGLLLSQAWDNFKAKLAKRSSDLY